MGRLAEDKQIHLNSQVDDITCLIADRNSLLTIIRNLVDNAIKFSPIQGEIKICATPVSDSELEVHVIDNGVGIPQEKIEHIFALQKDKVTKGTSGEKGTGLGLHLVKEMVELNEGSIHVSSTLGEGTTFTISLKNAP